LPWFVSDVVQLVAVSGAVLGLVLLRDGALNVLRVGGVRGWVLWCPGAATGGVHGW
jgi:hypothetical protein